MTLYELFESGICMQGHIKIQRWDDDKHTIFYNGDATEFYSDEHDDIMDCEAIYMFPYMNDYNEPSICIELAEE